MVRKIENINDYVTAGEAAHMLSQSHHRTISPDYISKLPKSKKHRVRTIQKHARLILYHRADIEACRIGGRAC